MRKLVFVMLMLFVVSVSVSASEYSFDVHDFGGETVTFVTWGNPFSTLEELERMEMAEEMFNVQIEVLQIGFADLVEAMMTRLLAGDAVYDMWQTTLTHFWPLLAQRAVYPVGNILPDGFYDDYLGIDTFVFQGENYAISDPFPDTNRFVLAWNKDLFAREGLPDLYDIYWAGEWTWDKLGEIGVDATRDTTGDGQIDQWGLEGIMYIGESAMFYTNEAALTREVDGRIMFTLTEPEAIEAINEMRRWATELEIAPVWGPRRDGFVQGTAAMAFLRMHEFAAVQATMEEDYGIVPMPMGPRAEKHRTPAPNTNTWVLPANAAEPLGMVSLYDFLFRQGVDEVEAQWDLEDMLASYVRDQESFQILLENWYNWEGELHRMLGVIPTNDTRQPIASAIGGAIGASAAMEEISAQIQSLLDDYFDQ